MSDNNETITMKNQTDRFTAYSIPDDNHINVEHQDGRKEKLLNHEFVDMVIQGKYQKVFFCKNCGAEQ